MKETQEKNLFIKYSQYISYFINIYHSRLEIGWKILLNNSSSIKFILSYFINIYHLLSHSIYLSFFLLKHIYSYIKKGYQMSKRIKTRFTGIFYRETFTHGKHDKVYYVIYKEDGKTKEVKAGKESEGMRPNYANNLRISILNSIRLGEDMPTILKQKEKKEKITFDTIAYLYFDSKKLHNKTNYRAQTKYESQLQPLLGYKDIHNITKTDILKIQKEFAETRAPKTVNQYIQFIRTVYNYAIEEEIFKGINPTKGINEQKVDNKRERYLTVDEVNHLLNHIQDKPDLYLFCLLSLSTGGRLVTITSIQKKDIVLSRNMINLDDKKNGTGYKGFFDDHIKHILEGTIKNINANDYIIKTNTRTLRRQLSKVLTLLFNSDLEKDDRKNRVVVHTLRHTFASQLAINGTPIFTIQKLLNHKDIKQTLRYAKLAPDSGSEMVNELLSLYIKS